MSARDLGVDSERRRFLSRLLRGTALLLFQGCSGYAVQQSCRYIPATPQYAPKNPEKGQAKEVVVHEVAPMETIPRLARMYGVSEQELASANGLQPGEALTAGQTLVIPHPTRYKNIVPVYRNDRWRYILVHHTAGKVGKALLVDQIHRDRGFEEGLGYHFLIDNGSLGKGDGQVEVAPRWIRQEQGAHCKASNMNVQSIGIGLVGNFNNRKPSPPQMNSLVQLVSTVGAYYQIPVSNVLPHRLVPGARTDCPGNLFPWKRFQLSLKKAMASPYC